MLLLAERHINLSKGFFFIFFNFLGWNKKVRACLFAAQLVKCKHTLPTHFIDDFKLIISSIKYTKIPHPIILPPINNRIDNLPPNFYFCHILSTIPSTISFQIFSFTTNHQQSHRYSPAYQKPNILYHAKN